MADVVRRSLLRSGRALRGAAPGRQAIFDDAAVLDRQHHVAGPAEDADAGERADGAHDEAGDLARLDRAGRVA